MNRVRSTAFVPTAIAPRRVLGAAWLAIITVGCSAGTVGRGPNDTTEPPIDEPPVSGTLGYPVLLAYFPTTTDSLRLPPRDSIAARFGDPDGPSIAAYYRELSGGRLTLRPDVDATWRSINGKFGSFTVTRLLRAMVRAVQASDPSFDWGRYDNDGPDGEPNSGDDDGFVDALVIVHSERGRECLPLAKTAADTTELINSLNSQRGRSTEDGPGYATHTRRAPSRAGRAASGAGADSIIRIDNYIIAAGQGGADGCTPGRAGAIGAIAHEFGHILGIPELYAQWKDAVPGEGSVGPGIGRWGLMGLGGIQTPLSPVRMSAWPLSQLGWVTQVPITRDTVVDITPIALSDTAFVIPIRGTGQYLMLSNRQAIGQDRSLLEESPYGGRLGVGLLVWHVDSLFMRSRGFDAGSCWKPRGALCGNTQSELRNSVNGATTPGLVLEPGDEKAQTIWGEFDPFDPRLANPDAALGPGKRSSIVFPSVVRLDVLEGVGPEGAQTLRVKVEFLGDGRTLDLGALELPVGNRDNDYSARLTLPGAENLRWEFEGDLPDGLRTAPDGTISGVPREWGQFALRVTATDGVHSAEAHLILRINRR